MKKIILSVAAMAALSFVSCKEEAQQVKDTTNTGIEQTKDAFSMDNSQVAPVLENTTIALDKTTHDFGTINEGDVVTTIYKVTNTGDKPLQLNKPKVSCGCTTPSYPKDLIMPGETQDIEVQFNSANKPNKQNKNVTLTGNFEGSPKIISFSATVNPAAKTAGAVEGPALQADPHAGHDH